MGDHAGVEVTVHAVDGVMVAAVRGSVDMLSAPALSARLITALSEHPRAIVIDLTEVDFLSSAGLQMLVELHADAAAHTTTMVVVADGPATRRPIELTGLDDTLSFYSTRTAALHTLTG